jgi:hypothetical protein
MSLENLLETNPYTITKRTTVAAWMNYTALKEKWNSMELRICVSIGWFKCGEGYMGTVGVF